MPHKTINRPLDRDLYEQLRGQSPLAWLPDHWQPFRTLLRQQLPASPPLTAGEQQRIYEAGLALRHFQASMQAGTTEPEAIRQLLRGVFGSLRYWLDRLPRSDKQHDLLNKLHDYLVADLNEWVQAITASNQSADYRIDIHRQRVQYARVSASDTATEAVIGLNEAIMAAFLLWVLITEWCWDTIVMD